MVKIFIQRIYSFKQNVNNSFKEFIHSKKMKMIHSKKIFIQVKNGLSPRAKFGRRRLSLFLISYLLLAKRFLPRFSSFILICSQPPLSLPLPAKIARKPRSPKLSPPFVTRCGCARLTVKHWLFLHRRIHRKMAEKLKRAESD